MDKVKEQTMRSYPQEPCVLCNRYMKLGYTNCLHCNMKLPSNTSKKEDNIDVSTKFRDACNSEPILDFCRWYLSQVGSYTELVELVQSKDLLDIHDTYKSKAINFASDIVKGYRR